MFWSNGCLRWGRERSSWRQERGYSCQSYPQMATPFSRPMGPELGAKKFPLPASVPHKTALHTSHHSAPEYKPLCLTLPEFHFYSAPHPPVLSAALCRAHHSEMTKCQLPAPLEDPPSPWRCQSEIPQAKARSCSITCQELETTAWRVPFPPPLL